MHESQATAECALGLVHVYSMLHKVAMLYLLVNVGASLRKLQLLCTKFTSQ